MSSEGIPAAVLTPPPPPLRRSFGQRRAKGLGSLAAYGQPMLWLTGGCLAVSLAMITGLLCLVLYQGSSTFWPVPVVLVETRDGHAYLGEITREESFRRPPASPTNTAQGQNNTADDKSPATDKAANGAQPPPAPADNIGHRELVRTGNFEVTGTHFHWINEDQIERQSLPPWAVVVERLSWGRFYGTPDAFLVDGQAVASDPSDVWSKYIEFHGQVRQRWHERTRSKSMRPTGSIAAATMPNSISNTPS